MHSSMMRTGRVPHASLHLIQRRASISAASAATRPQSVPRLLTISTRAAAGESLSSIDLEQDATPLSRSELQQQSSVDVASTSGRQEALAEAACRLECAWPRSFAEDYHLGDFIAGGSFGRVYDGTDLRTGDKVAVKVLSKLRTEKQAQRHRDKVEKEVSVLQELQGTEAGVLSLLGVYEDDESVYIVTELCRGGDLGSFIQSHGTLTEREAARVVSAVLGVLAAAHERGICYGDVKPANFLLREAYPDPHNPAELEIVVADFGGSERLGPGCSLERPAGTPLYLAPEVFLCNYGLQSDVWGVGVLLYQMLCGQYPFVDPSARPSPMALAMAVMTSDLEFGHPRWADVSDGARSLVEAMLDRDPEARATPSAALAHPWLEQMRQADEWGLPNWALRTYGPAAATVSEGQPQDAQQ